MTVSEGSEECPHDGEFVPRPEMKQLPPVVKGRVKALKNLQLNKIKAECEYYREVSLLDIRYQAKFDEINQRRAKVTNGSYEPKGTELDWKSDSDDEGDVEALGDEVKALSVHPDYPENVKGVPKFWLHVFKNANEECLMGFVEPHDEDVLCYMTDLTVSLRTDGFTLHFLFDENPYFTNQVLTKDYNFREGPDPKYPLTYDGPEIVSSTGCSIDWKEGKDVTKMIIKVETENGKMEQVETDSFFDFFSPPVLSEHSNEVLSHVTEEKAAQMIDFDVGFALKEKIIPRAVLYFTGEIFNHDDDNLSVATGSVGSCENCEEAADSVPVPGDSQ